MIGVTPGERGTIGAALRMAGIVGAALRLVFGRRGYVIGAIVTTALTAALYAWAGQIVTFYPDGTSYVNTEPAHLAALAALALLMGLVLPVQVFALRRAAWGIRQGGSGLIGFVTGLGSLTCCSPLLVPALLSLAGFSGSSLLTLNTTLYRYFAPLAAASAAFLLLSLVLSARDVTRACALRPLPAPPPGPTGTPARETSRPAHQTNHEQIRYEQGPARRPR